MLTCVVDFVHVGIIVDVQVYVNLDYKNVQECSKIYKINA